MKIFKSLLLCLSLMLVPLMTSAANGANAVGMVDWKNGVVQVSGVGYPPTNAKNPAQAITMSRRAAVLDGYRNLLETIDGVQVDAETTVNDLVLNDTIRAKVSGIVKGAHIVDEQQASDGSYRLTMEVRIFGENSIAQAVIPSIAPSVVQPLPEPTQNIVATNGYTGVVIEAKGLGLERCMSPVIKDDKGRVIYGNQNIDVDLITKNGAVDYASDEEMNNIVRYGNSRAGKNPLIIKATKVSDFNRNIVISEEDANKLLVENKGTNFLGKTSVVFVM